MKDFFELLFKSSKERIRNPLIASFLVSWLIFNWKSVLTMLFSDNSIEQRVRIVSPKNGIKEPGFWWPLLVAVIYVVLLPYLMLVVDFLTKDSFDKRKKNASNRRTTELKHSTEVVKAEVENEKLRTEYKDVRELNNRIEELTSNLEILDGQLEESNDKLIEAKRENSSLKVKLAEVEAIIEESKPVKNSQDSDIVYEGRMRKRLLTDLRSDLNTINLKAAREFSSNFDDIDKTRRRLTGTLDEIKNSLLGVFNGYSFPEDYELKEIIVKKLGMIEDDAEKHVKEIMAVRMHDSQMRVKMTEILGPIYDLLTTKKK